MDSKQQDNNPHIQIPNPYEAYNESMDNLAKENPELLEIGRLCYEIFLMNEDGKRLFEVLQERFLFSTLTNPLAPSASNCAIYWSGYTDCIKFFRANALEHKKRVLSQ